MTPGRSFGQIFNIGTQTAFKVKTVSQFLVSPFVRNINPDSTSQISLLAQMVQNPLQFKCDIFKDSLIRFESNAGARAPARTKLLNLAFNFALFVFLGVSESLAANLRPHPTGQSANHRNADAVQAAGHLIGLAAEFGPGVQGRHDRFQG